MQKLSLVVTMMLVLASCASPQQIKEVMATQRPPTAAEKAAIVQAAKDYLVDPYSVRDAEISNVVRLSDQGLEALCVKANAKNRMGGYVGRRATSVRMLHGKPIGTLDDAPACDLPQLQYHPFPELEAL